jgi:hypothetical protein
MGDGSIVEYGKLTKEPTQVQRGHERSPLYHCLYLGMVEVRASPDINEIMGLRDNEGGSVDASSQPRFLMCQRGTLQLLATRQLYQ